MASISLTTVPDSVNISVLAVGGACIVLLVVLAVRNRHPAVLADEGPNGYASLVLPIPKLKLYQKKVTRTFAAYFDSLLPLEYKIRPLDLYWLKLRLEHDFSGLGTKYFKYQSSVTDKWFFVCNKVSAVLLLNTIANLFFYGRSERCLVSHSQSDCHSVRVIPAISESVCAWDESSQVCRYRNTLSPSSSPVNVLLLVMALLCCQSLLDRLLTILYHHAKIRIRGGLCTICYEGEAAEEPHGDEWSSNSHSEMREERKEQQQHSSGHPTGYYDADLEAMEEAGDELKQCQSRRTTLARGVCFSLMRRLLDFVSPAAEVRWMLTNQTFKWTWILLPARTIKDSSNSNSSCSSNAWQALLYRCRSLYYRWYHLSDPQTLYAVVDHGHLYNHQLLVDVLVTNRRRAGEIRADVAKRSDEEQQDTALMQHFLTHSLVGVKRKVAEWLLLHTERRVAQRQDRLGLQYLALLLLPLYYCLSLLVVFYYGNRVSPGSTPLWVMGSVAALVEEFLLLQPFRIWLVHVWVPSMARVEYLALHSVLTVRARTILTRSRGLVRNLNSVVQHYHPACRAARLLPHLSSARILMSLTDYDLPVNQLIERLRPRFKPGKVSAVDTRSPLYYDFCSTVKNNTVILGDLLYDVVSTGVYWGVSLLVYWLLCLPHWLQVTLVEWACVLLLNLLAVGLYLSSRVSIVLTVVASVVLVVVSVVMSYRHYYIVSNTDVNRYGIVERVGYKRRKPKAVLVKAPVV